MSVTENDFTAVSIFVNPTQFGTNEDFEAYPCTLDSDLDVVTKASDDVLFAPNLHEMYPSADNTWVEVTGQVTHELCGKSRPIHFRGFTTVVCKLFNIVTTTRAYFGQKDVQHVEVLRRMVKDLFFDIDLRIMPINREDSGLARSSRNTYLSNEERQAAIVLSKSLTEALELYKSGQRSASAIIDNTRKIIEK